jgi:hypothetical protein
MNTNTAIDYKHIATTNRFELSFCDPPKIQYLPNYKIISCDGTPIESTDITTNDRFLGKFKIHTPQERKDSNYGIHSGTHVGLDGTEYEVESVYILTQGMNNILFISDNAIKRFQEI